MLPETVWEQAGRLLHPNSGSEVNFTCGIHLKKTTFWGEESTTSINLSTIDTQFLALFGLQPVTVARVWKWIRQPSLAKNVGRQMGCSHERVTTHKF
jgi:hypothetical protein